MRFSVYIVSEVYMKRLFLLLNLLLITASLSAASWTPDVKAYASAVFSINTAGDNDRLPSRTAFALNIEASPLAVSFSSHRLSSGLRLSITSDSLEYMNTTLLGSDRLSVFIGYEKAFGHLAIGVDAGIGLALVNRQDIMYAFLDSSLTLAWQLASCFSVNFRTGFVYYRQRFEIQPGIGACLILPPGDRK